MKQKGVVVFGLVLLGVVLCFGKLPSEVLDLKPWLLQTPFGKQGDPEEIRQPALEKFSHPPEFYAQDDHVVFLAYVNGSHTGGSEFPRVELSELVHFSSSEGTHRMIVRHAYTHVPEKRPEVVGAQILHPTGPLLQVRLNFPNIVVYGGAGNKAIYKDYKLGTIVTTEVLVQHNKVSVFLDGKMQMSWSINAPKMTFKAGAYVQSNLSFDKADQFGSVAIYNLTTIHTGTTQSILT
eukprot:TRINITY_DN11398_c0_g1_i1.p1 TRINITY_DN11398_c0_g1~~TRINITY_DN11398_c0_g1_i1.p1  ORF type:complete len:245 (+),score=53.33 TRINITY_DN11398_c0_g1_i1:30-737(+)